jgi:hypothetical protein
MISSSSGLNKHTCKKRRLQRATSLHEIYRQQRELMPSIRAHLHCKHISTTQHYTHRPSLSAISLIAQHKLMLIHKRNTKTD